MAQDPLPIESPTREDLISLLSEASEIEHQLLCVYLFAAYSLKSDLAEGGMTPDEFNCVSDWAGFDHRRGRSGDASSLPGVEHVDLDRWSATL